MAEVTGTIGGQPVELNNAATEATLRAMLAAMNRQTAALSALKNGGGGGGNTTQATQQQTAATQKQTGATNQQTQATGQLTGATNAATASMSAFAKGAMLLGGIVGDLVGGVAKTASNLTDFAGGLIDGKGGLSDFYGAMKDLPLGLGLVAGLFQKIAQMQEAELKSYRDLSKAGVNFGGSLNTVRQNALNLGMTMDEYTKVISNNREALLKLGGNTDTGAVAFQNMAMTLRKSDIGMQLMAMGNTTEDITNGLGSYIKATGVRSKAEMDNVSTQRALAQSAGEYMKNLQTLSQLTGESKEALEAKMAEETQEAQYQQYLSTLSEDQKAKANQAMAEATARFGKAGAQATKDLLMGLPPMTEAGQQIMAQSKGFAQAANGYVKIVNDSSLRGEKAQERISLTTDKGVKAMGEEAKAMGTTNYALGRLGGVASEVAATQAKSNAALIGADGDLTKQRHDQLKANEALQDSAAAQAVKSEKAFKDMGAAIYGALQPALAMLTPIVNDLANQFMEMVKNNMPAIKSALTTLVTFVTNFAKDLFSEEGRKKIINDIIYYMKLMLIEIKKAIVPFYGEDSAKRDTDKLDAEKKAYDAKAEVAREEMANAGKIQALNDIKANKTKESFDTEIKTSADKIADLEKQKTAAGTDAEKIKKINKDIAAEEEAQANLKRRQTNLVKLVDNPEERKAVEAKKQEIETKKADADKLVKESAPDYNAPKEKSQDDKNWEKMGIGDKIESGAARGIEKAGSMLGAILPDFLGGGILQNLSKTAKDDRIQGETDELARREAEAKKKGVEKRAEGGPVKAGQPYWVGEEGPEIMVPDAAGKITPSDKTADMQPHLANMSKSISGNFKGVASDIAASSQQQQPITLSKESIAALGKLLPLDNMSGIKQPELPKDSKTSGDMKNHMESMTKDINASLGRMSEKALDPKKNLEKDFKDIPPIPEELMNSLMSKRMPKSKESTGADTTNEMISSLVKQTQLSKEGNKEPVDMKSYLAGMTKDINNSLSGVTEKMLGNKKTPDIDTYNETLKKLIPDPTAKATPVLEDKKTALPEQPKTPMLTDMLGSFAKTIMPEFMSKIPSVGDLGKKIDDIKKDPKGEMESMGKTITDGIKNVAGMSPAGALLNPLLGAMGGSGGNENLLKEMQQLNKNTVELVKYTKMTLEENKNQTSKLGSLSGNLYV